MIWKPNVHLYWGWKVSFDANGSIGQYRGDIVGQKDQERKIALQVETKKTF